MGDDDEMARRWSGLHREWQENGCVVLRQLLNPEQLAVCRKAYDGFMAEKTKLSIVTEDVLNDSQPRAGLRDELFLPVLEAVPGFAEVCKELWGTSERVWLMDAEYFKKTKQAVSTSFHQDTSIIPAKGEHAINFHISFEDQTPKEYCLEVVRGSAWGPVYDNTLAFAGAEARAKSTKVPRPGWPRLPEVNELRKAQPDLICSWDLKAGDVVAFHPNSLHGGGAVDPNNHPERNTLVFRFFGDDFVYRDSHVIKGTFAVGSIYERGTGPNSDGGRGGLTEGDPYTKIPNRDGSWLRILGPPGPAEGEEVAVPSLLLRSGSRL